MEETCAKANLVYDGFWGFIKKDWKAVALNFMSIIATFLIFGPLVKAIDLWASGKTYEILSFDVPLEYVWNIFISLSFYGTGYFGQDFILRSVVKSVQNRLIKEAIDYKTNIADDHTHNREHPTPVAQTINKDEKGN